MRTWLGAVMAVGLAGVALVACGGSAKAPDAITRGTPGAGPIDPVVPDDSSDGGTPPQATPEIVDGGCCSVEFALPQQDGEIDAQLVFRDQTYPMTAQDGGWFVDACVDLVTTDYYFQTAYPSDVDGGDPVWVNQVNYAVETSDTSTVAPRVNVFQVPDGGTCEGFDSTPYSQLPDAG